MQSRDLQRQPIYLAAPYTHPSEGVRQARFEAVTRAAASLIRSGRIVYSPITMTHPIDVVLAKETGTLGSDFWVTFDEAFMSFCSEIVVLRLDGWQQSSGVRREISYFEGRGLRVSFRDPDGSEVPDVPLNT